MAHEFRCAPAISARTLTLRGRDLELQGVRASVRSRAHVIVAGPFGAGCTRIVDEFRQQPDVCVVDDVHRLDDTSRRDLLAGAGDGPRLVIALHAEDRAALGVVLRPWRMLKARLVLLGSLGRDDQVAICEDLLAGPVNRSGCDVLFSMSGGRPGDLVELVLGSLEVGALRPGPAGWALTGAPSLDRLAPRLESQLRDPVLRSAARALASAEPVALCDATELVDRDHLDRLQATGVVEIVEGRDESSLHVVRPALGEWLRRQGGVHHRRRRSDRSERADGGSDAMPDPSAWDVVACAVDAGLPEARRRVRDVDAAPVSPEQELAGAMARMVVAARSLDADATARQAAVLREAADPGPGLPRPQVLADASEVERRAFAGRDLTELSRSCAAARRQASEAGRPEERALWNAVSSSVAIAAGRPQRAVTLLAATRASAQRRGSDPGVTLITMRQVWASAQSGAVFEARTLLEGSVRRLARQPTVAWRAYLEALIQLVVDPAMPAREFDTIGRDAIDSGDPHLALEVAATQVRLDGVSPATLEFVEHLDGQVDGGRVEVLGDHARAVADRDPHRLVAVAARWCAAGRLGDAVEALLRAASLESGPRRQLYRRRAAVLLGACEGAWSPSAAGLDAVSLDDESVRIGNCVVRGLRNRDISARFGISMSKVEKHLSRMYRRLGVSDRRELDVFFGSMFRRAPVRAG